MPGRWRRYSDYRRTGRSGYRMPVRRRYFAPVRTDPKAHPAFYKMGDRAVLGGKAVGRSLNHPPPSSAEINPLTPNDDYSGRTAPLTSKCCILHIYSTNICTEYFKNGIYCPFFSLQNAVCFINLTYLVPVLFTFYIQGVLKLKK